MKISSPAKNEMSGMPCGTNRATILPSPIGVQYQSINRHPPSACSLRGLQLIIRFMTIISWGHVRGCSHQSNIACCMLADVLTNRFSAVYVAFLENQCLEFFWKPHVSCGIGSCHPRVLCWTFRHVIRIGWSHRRDTTATSP